MTAPVDVLALIAAIAANNPNAEQPPLRPVPAEPDEFTQRLWAGTYDWCGSLWHMASIERRKHPWANI